MNYEKLRSDQFVRISARILAEVSDYKKKYYKDVEKKLLVFMRKKDDKVTMKTSISQIKESIRKKNTFAMKFKNTAC